MVDQNVTSHWGIPPITDVAYVFTYSDPEFSLCFSDVPKSALACTEVDNPCCAAIDKI